MIKHESETEYILLTANKLDINFALENVILPWTGGTSIFVGSTRDCFEQKKVLTLFYEAYEAMAVNEILNICNDIRNKYSVGKMCILHRLGEVPVTEASVIISISSKHRKNAIEAVEYAINELKAKVPIWKKEIYANGESDWKENKEVFWRTTKP